MGNLFIVKSMERSQASLVDITATLFPDGPFPFTYWLPCLRCYLLLTTLVP